ncbi:hypothetical protein TorRG33x02_201870 [Trema orientale]|uniref:Uncharacterized protein n=1 Tax=Trema orientale TaxID=63057 RepID=A0A2P5EEU4_TREOI|nr:hypothetical protein TorRG33x02_201870 [Trema orientale]
MKPNERERERERDQSNGGDESISSAERVEDAVLPLSGLIDLVPPIEKLMSSLLHLHRHRSRAQHHSGHFTPVSQSKTNPNSSIKCVRERERETKSSSLL